jgi:hypothetical protein
MTTTRRENKLVQLFSCLSAAFVLVGSWLPAGSPQSATEMDGKDLEARTLLQTDTICR